MPRTQIDEEELGKKLVTFFKSYFSESQADEEPEEGKPLSGEGKIQKDFKFITNLRMSTRIGDKNTQGDDILFNFLNKVFDESTEKVDEFLGTFIRDAITQKVFNEAGFRFGLSRFLQLIPDVAADIPNLPSQFVKHVLAPIMEEIKGFKLEDLTWLTKDQEEDEYTEIACHYKIGAEIIKHKLALGKTDDQVTKEWEKECGKAFTQINKMMIASDSKEWIRNDVKEFSGIGDDHVALTILKLK